MRGVERRGQQAAACWSSGHRSRPPEASSRFAGHYRRLRAGSSPEATRWSRVARPERGDAIATRLRWVCRDWEDDLAERLHPVAALVDPAGRNGGRNGGYVFAAAGACAQGQSSRRCGLATHVLLFWPSLRFYGCSPLWAPALPLTAAFYSGATIHSAIVYWRGRGGMWKGRVQDAR